MTVVPERLAWLDSLVLAHGAHGSVEEGACALEAVAYVAGEPWSDRPDCASQVIGAFLRNWNDSLNDEDRQMLKPLIPRLVGTKASKAIESKRAWMAVDWLARVQAPAWLRLANKIELAESLEGMDELVDAASAKAAQPRLSAAWDAAWDAAAARDAPWAAWDAAGDAAAARDAAGAAGAAAWDAAWDAAAARDAPWAAWDAAWDAAAARDAAWDAGAAAWDAARAAAWDAAWDALRPTVVTLQQSALELVKRMIDVQNQDR